MNFAIDNENEKEKKYSIAINVRTAGMRDNINEFSRQMKNLDEIIIDFFNVTSSLNNNWKGKNANIAFEEIENIFHSMAEVMKNNEKYVSELKKYCNSYEDAEQTISKNEDSLDA